MNTPKRTDAAMEKARKGKRGWIAVRIMTFEGPVPVKPMRVYWTKHAAEKAAEKLEKTEGGDDYHGEVMEVWVPRI